MSEPHVGLQYTLRRDTPQPAPREPHAIKQRLLLAPGALTFSPGMDTEERQMHPGGGRTSGTCRWKVQDSQVPHVFERKVSVAG
ncbi:hypothetical protein NDU88_007407 [Pleurodeles waltl]|uniref:Uncharacterized protein n=1 Tax=Pleurodeles waltl TaxID=8319 RepID=A0AAV7U2Z5_PLEWA|nr:hypothetical protein NDU88_007407 [Pleurodeles waltl]